MSRGARARFLGLLQRRLNPLTLRAARRGRGPFSLIRTVGRKTGRVYETPLILAAVPGGFITELTYGPTVQWYRNLVAAGGAVVVVHGVEHRVGAPQPYDPERGRRAFGFPASLLLKLLRKKEYRLLAVSPPSEQHR